jgi:hypothetical protein
VGQQTFKQVETLPSKFLFTRHSQLSFHVIRCLMATEFETSSLNNLGTNNETIQSLEADTSGRGV